MDRKAVEALGLIRKQKLSPQGAVVLCSLISKISEMGGPSDVLFDALVNALIEENANITFFLEKWLSAKSEEGRLKRLADIVSAIELSRTVTITQKDVEERSEALAPVLREFKTLLSAKIRDEYLGGIPALIAELDFKKSAFYRFLSEDRMPNTKMARLIVEIMKKINLKEVSIVRGNPLLEVNRA